MSIKTLSAFVVGTLTIFLPPANAEIVRTPVEDARPLLVAAINSPTGEAHGLLVGQLADAITRRFQAKSPIYIDVTTEKRFTQEGCSRLKVLFSQDGVLLPGKAKPEKRGVEFGINYCRDGSPPKNLS